MQMRKITEEEQMQVVRKELSGATEKSIEAIIANAAGKFPLKK